MANFRFKGTFCDPNDLSYPDCTLFCVADVTKDDGGGESNVKSTLDVIKIPGATDKYILTVWNSANKPKKSNKALRPLATNAQRKKGAKKGAKKPSKKGK